MYCGAVGMQLWAHVTLVRERSSVPWFLIFQKGYYYYYYYILG
jgi:hypothetical protein